MVRPLRAENSPPFTTAMIILASVISSTVSNALLGTESAFTVPSYDLKSASGIYLLVMNFFPFSDCSFDACMYLCKFLGVITASDIRSKSNSLFNEEIDEFAALLIFGIKLCFLYA